MWDFLDNLNDAIVVFDKDKRVKYINKMAMSEWKETDFGEPC